MSNDPQPNWRDTASEPVTPSGSRPWQPRDVGPPAAPPVSKRNVLRLAALSALVATVAGIGAVVVWLRPGKPACLALVGSGYERNLMLPHNVHGWNGLAILDRSAAQDDDYKDAFRWPWNPPGKMRRIGDPIEVRDQSWQDVWNKLDVASQPEKTVVLFVSLHGMADQDEAYLLPNFTVKPSPKAFLQARIPFRDVLDSCKSVKKNIVLLVDATQVAAHWPIGMLHNDFVERLQEKYDSRIKAMGNLVVICSTGPDQRSWASDELQNSIFGHYVSLGLQGAGLNGHERITAWRLFKYVEDRVDKWAQTNRARRQTPILLGDENLAREMEIAYIGESFAEPEPPLGAFAPESVRPEWSKWRDLESEHFAQVYAPHLWRLYQATLLRYEQLLRAGDPTNQAGALKKSLINLHADILAARTVDRTFACLANSLPMPAFLGYQPDPDLNGLAVQTFLTSLRKADTGAERLKLMERFRTRSARDKQYLQLAISRLVLSDVDSLTMTECLREQERLAELEREMHVPLRPAEAQLLKMLQDADPTLDSELVRLALRTRMAAEAAALGGGDGSTYAEALLAWTEPVVNRGDPLRRDGEDWLFGDPRLDAVQARTKLTQAAAQYSEARKIAAKAQRAMALRDTVSAKLPYYAAWLAALPPTAKHVGGDNHAMRVAVENASAALAALNRALDVEHKLPADAELDELAADAMLLQSGMQAAAQRLRKSAVLQQNWHAIDAVLSVPPGDARSDDVDLRIALLAKLRSISGELLHSTDLEGQAEAPELVRAGVDRQRLLLRACIRPIEDIRGPERGNVDDAARDFFLKAPQDIVRGSGGLVGDDGEPGLAQAARLCRAIPAFAADLVRNEQSERINPVDRLRRLRTHRLLIWLAQRTWDDHWFEPGPARDTYYIPAAKAYLDTAGGLFDSDQLSPAFLRAAEDVQKKLVPAGLAVTKDADPYWTTEFNFPLAWQIQSEPGVPRGTPMVWLEVTANDKVAGARQTEPRKAVIPWPTPQTPYVEPFHVNRKGVPADARLAARFHMLYRGQHRTRDLQLLRGQPQIIIRNFPAPDKAGLAVRMDSAFDYGAVSIVLDNSGSMSWVYPERGAKDKGRRADRKNGERRRFDYALDALAHVLKKVPDNTYLSLFTLGRKEGADYVTVPTEYRPPTRWRQKELDTLLGDISEIPGDISSPIADAVVKSMAEGFPPGFQGPKVVLVLTDGDDNYSFGSVYDPASEPDVARHAQTVAAGLRKAAADHPDVLIYVVCFIQKDNPEYLRAAAQFKGIEQFDLPGQFLVVPEAERLGHAIEGLIRPRLELRLDGRPVNGFATGQPVNYPGDLALNWIDVRPNTFRGRLRRSLGSDIAVELPPGHNVFGVLKRNEKDYYLERGVLGQQREIADNKAMPTPLAKEGWLTSLLENHNSLTNRLSQVMVLEKMLVEKNVLRQSQPGFTWLELTGADGKRPPQTLTWGRDWNLPAAAFRLELPDWPIQRWSKTAAWFWPDGRDQLLANDKLYARASVPIGRATPTVPTGRLLAEPVIESALWEERELDAPAGGTVKEKCLVIRVRHAPGRPVYVALDPEQSNVGSLHEYFLGAARYTASFYRLANVETAHLIVIDVEAFKKAAPHVEFIPDERYRAPGMFINRLE